MKLHPPCGKREEKYPESHGLLFLQFLELYTGLKDKGLRLCRSVSIFLLEGQVAHPLNFFAVLCSFVIHIPNTQSPGKPKKMLKFLDVGLLQCLLKFC